MVNPVPQYIWKLPLSPYNQAMMSRKNLVRILLINNFANDLLILSDMGFFEPSVIGGGGGEGGGA